MLRKYDNFIKQFSNFQVNLESFSGFLFFFKLYVMVTFKPESMNPMWSLEGFFVGLVEFVIFFLFVGVFFAVILRVSLCSECC